MIKKRQPPHKLSVYFIKALSPCAAAIVIFFFDVALHIVVCGRYFTISELALNADIRNRDYIFLAVSLVLPHTKKKKTFYGIFRFFFLLSYCVRHTVVVCNSMWIRNELVKKNCRLTLPTIDLVTYIALAFLFRNINRAVRTSLNVRARSIFVSFISSFYCV